MIALQYSNVGLSISVKRNDENVVKIQNKHKNVTISIEGTVAILEHCALGSGLWRKRILA